MELFWIVVYAYAAIVIFSIIVGLQKGMAEEFWNFLTDISERFDIYHRVK